MKNVKHLFLGLILILVSSVSFAGPPEVIPKIEMVKETVKSVLFTTPVVNEIVVTCKASAYEVVIVTELTRQKDVFVFANAPCLTSTFVVKKFPALCDPVNRHSHHIRQPNTELKHIKQITTSRQLLLIPLTNVSITCIGRAIYKIP